MSKASKAARQMASQDRRKRGIEEVVEATNKDSKRPKHP